MAIGGINLNAIVSKVLDPLHRIEMVQWKKFIETHIDEEGRTCSHYADPVWISAQIQTPNDKQQEYVRKVNDNTVARRFWVNALVSPLDRAKDHGGDILVYDGFEWLVTSQPDEFDKQGWVSVIAERLLPNDAKGCEHSVP